MTELVEGVAFGEVKWACPFSHSPNKPEEHDNVMPPVNGEKTNNAKTLKGRLEDQIDNQRVRLSIGGIARPLDVQFTAHHLLPGNESWPETALLKWVDKEAEGSLVNDDIGYDVNHGSNGVDLPGIHGVGTTVWSSWDLPDSDVQDRYAFLAMRSTEPPRQFHDKHDAYSSFVVNVLDVIAAKLDKHNNGATPGCGKEHCGGSKKSGGKVEPPYNIISRLQAVSERLAKRLVTDPRNWRKPIFTSRFALMYKTRYTRALSQDEARAELSTSK